LQASIASVQTLVSSSIDSISYHFINIFPAISKDSHQISEELILKVGKFEKAFKNFGIKIQEGVNLMNEHADYYNGQL